MPLYNGFKTEKGQGATILHNFGCRVDSHNHPVEALQNMSFNDIDEGTKQTINDLFDKGYTPSLAYQETIRMIRSETENDVQFLVKKCLIDQKCHVKVISTFFSNMEQEIFLRFKNT